mgnify:CR=1 FL=1
MGVLSYLKSGLSDSVETDPDLAYQDRILPGVSRTFALTIPQLPSPLCKAVANAYLLCRIADTIEDEPALSAEQKTHFHQQFVSVLYGQQSARNFAESLAPNLSERTTMEERDLVGNTDRVVSVTRGLPQLQQHAISRCVEIMSIGMPEFERHASPGGLRKLDDMERYCYYVAGVVGQMLTELFCDYSPRIRHQRSELQPLAVSFGRGLQMTNILKDIWDDYEHGFCWLPASVFGHSRLDLGQIRHEDGNRTFRQGLTELVGLAHGHLRNALEFTLLIPAEEVGIRRFCLWAIGMAIMTLRKIQKNPDFTSSKDVKISKMTVRAVVLLSNGAVSNDWVLRKLFRVAAEPLPVRTPAMEEPPDTVAASTSERAGHCIQEPAVRPDTCS